MTLSIPLIRTDGGTQPRAEKSDDLIAEYRADMLTGATFPPVVVFYDGSEYWLADGFHRLYAAQQLGKTELEADVRQGTRRDAVLYSVGANTAHGLRRTNDDKRRAVVTLLNDEEWQQWSDSEIARRCGVSHEFVRQLRPSLATIASDSRTYTNRYGQVATMQTAHIGSNGNGHTHSAPTFNGEPDTEPADDRTIDPVTGEINEPVTLPPVEEPMPNRAYKNSSDSNEWYTPAPYIERARAVMGGIDLDPASSATANETVKAETYYTIEDDGLLQTWLGRIWLNPPYGNEVEAFVGKLVGDYKAGDVKEAILLVAARTDTQWFRKLREYPRCFLWGRVKFVNGATGEPGDPAGFPSMVVYLGSNFTRFVEAFEDIGDIYTLWR